MAISMLVANASIDFPTGTYDYTKIKEAKEEAIKSNKPLAYIDTNAEAPADGKWIFEVTQAYIKALGDRFVIVHLPAKKRQEYEPLVDAMVLKAHKRYFPSLVIASPGDDRILLTMSSEEYQKSPDLLHEKLRKAAAQEKASTTEKLKLNLPSNYYDHTQLKEAYAEAKASNKPLAFIHTEKDVPSSYSWVGEPTNAYLKAIGDDCVVVYLNVVNYKDYESSLPRCVRGFMDRGFPSLVIRSFDEISKDENPEMLDVLDYEDLTAPELERKIKGMIKPPASSGGLEAGNLPIGSISRNM